MKKNDKTKQLILEQLSKTPIIELACQKAGVSRMSFYRWKDEDKEFSTQIEKALVDGRSMVNDLAESQLISAVRDRNITAIIAWLKHNHPSYKTRIEIEGSLKVIEELSPEQEELVRKALTLANLK
jgi:hypothetical protein